MNRYYLPTGAVMVSHASVLSQLMADLGAPAPAFYHETYDNGAIPRVGVVVKGFPFDPEFTKDYSVMWHTSDFSQAFQSVSSKAVQDLRTKYAAYLRGTGYATIPPVNPGVGSQPVQTGPIAPDLQAWAGPSAIGTMASAKDRNGAPTKRTTLHDLYELQGQSPWYDNLCRPVTDLLPLITSGVRGVTSNPTIFQKAISSSNAYDEQFKQLISAGKDAESAYWELVIKDIQDACKLFEPIYNQTDGGDGYVSVEVSPRLANDTQGTIEAAKWLHKVVNRPNVYIKIPATAECVPSIREVIANGISVNVTLIFSIARYEAVIDAYLDGLEASGLSDLSRVTSVASFFVSRVDTLIDKMLEKIGTPEALALRGKAAVAQAKLANQLYQKKFSGPRWEALAKKGAKKQRLLWASTSVKSPAYPDTLYVDPLIGPDTVSTMPDQALQAFMDHGTVARTIDANVSDAEGVYSALEKLGIDWDEVGKQLELEGVDSFKKSFDSLLVSLQEKGNALKAVNL